MALMASSSQKESRSRKKLKKEKKKPKPDDICHDCGGLGYWRNQSAYPKQKENNSQAKNLANIAIDSLNSLEEHKVKKLLMVVKENLISEGLTLDCGTILHIFADRGFFFKFKPKNTRHFITIGSHN